MTIKESLKKIYKALSGGQTTESRSISSILNDISTVASGGSAPSSGGDVVVFTIIEDLDTGDFTASKTYQEVLDAVSEGKTVICAYTNYPADPTSTKYLTLRTGGYDQDDNQMLYFYGIGIEYDGVNRRHTIEYDKIAYHSDNTFELLMGVSFDVDEPQIGETPITL